MTKKANAKPVIYESPDGGNTVYSRPVDSLERELAWRKPAHAKALAERDRWYEWRDILAASVDYPSLALAIKQAELIYALSKKEGK